MLNEIECERSTAATAGRSRLEASLRRLSPDELRAFWEAVRRCYASHPTHEG